LLESRLKDAKALLAAKRYDGSVYLCGYSVEIGLKARICRTLKWDGFPSTNKFVEQMSKAFGQDEVMSFSRIVTLNHDDPALRAILSESASLKKPLEKQGHDLFGLPIEHAVILRAAQPKAA
jgi:hypothetical protein